MAAVPPIAAIALPVPANDRWSPVRTRGMALEEENRVLRAMLARRVRISTDARAAYEQQLADMRAALACASRWNATALMVATLAHELNQPLTAAANYLEAARRTLAGSSADATGDTLGELLARGARQAAQAGAIIRNLREFIDKRETPRAFDDINAVVEDAVTLGLAGAARRNVGLSVMLAPALPRLLVNRVEIQQVLVNLFRNALEAMRHAKRRTLTVTTRAEGEDAVLLTVSNTGAGVSAETLARLFQPFASTKRDGMGLGLKICQSIVEAHRGKIWATSSEAGGVAFHIRLPVIGSDPSG